MTATSSPLRRLLFVLLPVLVLAAGVLIALLLLNTSPKARQAPPPPSSALVAVAPVAFGSETIEIEAMGTVVPARVIDLHPQVEGAIINVAPAFEPGGRFRAGETVLTIDPTDYQLGVRRLTSDLARAEADLRVELGNQTVARREFELLGEKLTEEDRDLVLRTPQLETVRAEVAAARAALDKAELDLERTRVTAPFNAVVLDRQVNLGSRVGTSTLLARLVGTDAYWIETSVPVDQLRWLTVPTEPGTSGSAVKIYNPSAWGADQWRAGTLVHLASDLEKQGRMARVMVRVEDPLSLRQSTPPLLIDSYVRVVFTGKTLDNVARIERSWLRDDDRLWIMDNEGRLAIRAADVIHRGRETVLVRDGLSVGERLVTSDLATPVQGMPLRTVETGEGKAQP